MLKEPTSEGPSFDGGVKGGGVTTYFEVYRKLSTIDRMPLQRGDGANVPGFDPLTLF